MTAQLARDCSDGNRRSQGNVPESQFGLKGEWKSIPNKSDCIDVKQESHL